MTHTDPAPRLPQVWPCTQALDDSVRAMAGGPLNGVRHSANAPSRLSHTTACPP
ncbi:hypothetical protein R0D99_09010 [Ottowia sp. SB7-C50]|nr:hypothetical protein [Ottowia sp. SB7-C50]WOP14048.1 hypothetical protein R0D99_09010 [Ottowia sp. SB7-C50]